MAGLNMNFDSIILQDRDIALLRGLFESRVMTAAHVGTLYFDGMHPYAVKRLRKLKAAGLVGERPRLVNKPAILFLTRKAFSFLSAEGHLSRFPSLSRNSFEVRANVSERTLRHELEIMDVKAAFHAALSSSEKFSITDFLTWPLLYHFEVSPNGYGRDIPVKPDGFLSIHEKEEGGKGFAHDCFLEVDRSSEVQEILVQKAGCYLEYLKSGGFAVWRGGSRTDYKEYPFRVLMVFKTAERRNNTAERLLRASPRSLTHAWLTTYSEVTTNPLGAIWMQPADYRDAARETLFDPEKQTPSFRYRHNVERERFIEATVKKRRLLDV